MLARTSAVDADIGSMQIAQVIQDAISCYR